MLGELVADGGADEVGAVGVEALLDEQVDLAEIDRAEVDGDLLRLTWSYHLYGWYADGARMSSPSPLSFNELASPVSHDCADAVLTAGARSMPGLCSRL